MPNSSAILIASVKLPLYNSSIKLVTLATAVFSASSALIPFSIFSLVKRASIFFEEMASCSKISIKARITSLNWFLLIDSASLKSNLS